MKESTADLLRRFNRPHAQVFRAYDHLIAARKGVTLMVPIAASDGKLVPLTDLCPVPLEEATAILNVDYAMAQPLHLVRLIKHAHSLPAVPRSPIECFARELLESFLQSDGILVHDQAWRQTLIRTSAGVEPCRVFVGEAGVRLAFVPDFLEGVL